MLRVFFWSGAALLLAAGVPRAADKDDAEEKVAVGKIASLEIKDDGDGALTILVRRPARVPLSPREMTFQVTKETRFLQGGGPGEEGAAVDAHEAAAWVKDSAAVTIRYLSEGDKLTAKTVSLVGAAARPDQPADGLAENAKARAQAAHKAFDLAIVQLRDGKGADGPERVYRWSRRWMEAEQELAAKAEDKVAAAEAHRKRMAELAETARRLVEAGALDAGEWAGVEFYSLEAERDLGRAKEK